MTQPKAIEWWRENAQPIFEREFLEELLTYTLFRKEEGNQSIFQPHERGSSVGLSPRLSRARSLLIEDILNQIGNLDARLAFVAAAHIAGPIEERLTTLRQRQWLASAAAQSFASSYRQIIVVRGIESLRQSFNNRPLNDHLNPELAALLTETGIDAAGIGFFYNQLGEAQDAADSLFALLNGTTVADHADLESVALNEQRIDLAVRVLYNRSRTAHIVGLRTLHGLAAEPVSVDSILALLSTLEPRHLIDVTEANRLLDDCLAEAVNILQERVALISVAEQLWKKALDSYAQLEKLLTMRRKRWKSIPEEDRLDVWFSLTKTEHVVLFWGLNPDDRIALLGILSPKEKERLLETIAYEDISPLSPKEKERLLETIAYEDIFP